MYGLVEWTLFICVIIEYCWVLLVNTVVYHRWMYFIGENCCVLLVNTVVYYWSILLCIIDEYCCVSLVNTVVHHWWILLCIIGEYSCVSLVNTAGYYCWILLYIIGIDLRQRWVKFTFGTASERKLRKLLTFSLDLIEFIQYDLN